MQLTCPHCRQSFDFSGPQPTFCGLCGQPLSVPRGDSLEQTIEHNPSADGVAPTLLGDLPASEGSANDIPETVADFRLIRSLGEGGMGAVWEAEQAGTGRRVALKLLSKRLPVTEETIGRFLREGRLAASVSHPRSTFVFGAGQDRGHPYIVMELMPGRTLADVVRDEGPLPVARAVDYILDVIEGLHAAHALGVIHRDLKPSNCFLDSEGRVKVGDFGLSKSLVSDAELTRTGSFLGTPQFAAPEQVRGGEVDRRTDVYAAGATLFCLLTGRGPFTGDAAAVIAQVASDRAPALRSLRPDAPQALDRIVARTLEKDPRERFENLARLQQALAPFATGGSSIADVGRRLAAYMIDSLVIGVAGTIGAMAVIVANFGYEVSRWDRNAAEAQTAHFTGPEEWMTLVQLAMQIAYFTLAEGRWGRGVGKLLMGLQVVGPNRECPGYIRAFVRTLVVPGAAGLALLLGLLPPMHLWETTDARFQAMFSSFAAGAAPTLFCLLCLTTMRARNGYRGLHELASGTRVVRPRKAGIVRRHDVPVVAPVAAAGAERALGPFRLTGELGRSGSREVFQAQDELLGRPVWIYIGPPEVPTASAARRGIARPTRPHWLQGGESRETRWEAFEPVVGSPIAEAARHGGRVTWDQKRHWLLDLAEELTAGVSDGTLPERLALDQVWVARGGRVKLLDAPVVPAGSDTDHTNEASGTAVDRAVALLRDATRVCTQHEVLPGHVQRFVSELGARPAAEETLGWAFAQLREAARSPTVLGWDDRLGILAVSMGTELSLYSLIAVSVPWLASAVFHLSLGACAALLSLVALVPAVAAAVFKGGPVFWLTKTEVVRHDGLPAGRLQCAWRSLVAWMGLMVPYGFLGLLVGKFAAPGSGEITFKGSTESNSMLIVASMCGVELVGLLFVIGAVWAVIQPRRGLQDRLARTHLVPR